jgi:hypothetical protein
MVEVPVGVDDGVDLEIRLADNLQYALGFVTRIDDSGFTGGFTSHDITDGLNRPDCK